MLEKMKTVSFWISILGAAKIIAQLFGLEIDDALVNNIANGFAGVATLVGIIMSHDKPKTDATNDNGNGI
jgi:uncharacterized membrane protein